METIKRKVLVTIEKEISVELPAELGTEQAIAEWKKGLWDIDSIDDIAMYAAEMAAKYGGGMEHDGLGLLSESHSKYPRIPDVKFDIIVDECETEII